MKNNDQGGFILMIVIMVAIAITIIGFAIYRITNANSATDIKAPSVMHMFNNESTSV